MNYKEGDLVQIVVRARIMKGHTGHGHCYQVELEQKDFSSPREFFVNEDEIDENWDEIPWKERGH